MGQEVVRGQGSTESAPSKRRVRDVSREMAYADGLKPITGIKVVKRGKGSK